MRGYFFIVTVVVIFLIGISLSCRAEMSGSGSFSAWYGLQQQLSPALSVSQPVLKAALLLGGAAEESGDTDMIFSQDRTPLAAILKAGTPAISHPNPRNPLVVASGIGENQHSLDLQPGSVLYMHTGAGTVDLGNGVSVRVEAGDVVVIAGQGNVRFEAESQYVSISHPDWRGADVARITDRIFKELELEQKGAQALRDQDGYWIATHYRASEKMPAIIAPLAPVDASISVGIKQELTPRYETAHRHQAQVDGLESMEIIIVADGPTITVDIADREGNFVAQRTLGPGDVLVAYTGMVHGFHMTAGAQLVIMKPGPFRAANDKIEVVITGKPTAPASSLIAAAI